MPQRPRGRDDDREPQSAAPPRPKGAWKNGYVPVLGLIGGIGAGKSLVAAELARHGAFVLDADAIGHALLDQGPARGEVVRRFGPDVLEPTSTNGIRRVDRKALGSVVFGDRHSLAALNEIMHPRMRRTFEKAIARVVRKREARAIVLDAAILLEAGWDDLCDLVAFVDAPDDRRLDRVREHRGWDAETLAAREKAQRPLDEKRRRADIVIANDADVETLAARVELLWKDLVRRRKPVAAAAPPSPPGPAPESGPRRRPAPANPTPRPPRRGRRPS